MHIAFAHPDLGIGGAERWLIDSARALQARGHTVTVYTSHHDKRHCFPETLAMDVVVVGDFLPTNLGGCLHLLFSMLRCLVLAGYVFLFRSRHLDVIVVDQISFAVPILRRCAKRCLFYCHYPDKLLAPKSCSYLRTRVYRGALDWLEERTILQADKIVVNSKFTATKFLEAFRSADEKPAVLYPGVEDTCQDDDRPPERGAGEAVFFSFQRFDRKKRIGMAIKAFSVTKADTNCRLVVAGGYDKRVLENRQCLKELQDLCQQLGISHHTVHNARLDDLAGAAQVLFLPSISDRLKRHLYRTAYFLLFTSDEEHFGLVPVEAQMHKLPVIAVDAGGPRETVRHEETGFLVEDSVEAVATCMRHVLNKLTKTRYDEMCRLARRHALTSFGIDRFGDQWEGLLHSLVSK